MSGPRAGPSPAAAAPQPAGPPPLDCSIRYFFPGTDGFDRLIFWVIPPAGANGPASGLLTVGGLPVTLQPLPGQGQRVAQWDPVENAAYYAPDGDWLATAGGATGTGRLMCGLDGGEYVETLPTFRVSFVAGSPAFAGNFSPTGATAAPLSPGATVPPGLTSVAPASTTALMTSWIAVPTPAGASAPLGYYSGPRHAGWFGTTGPSASLLEPAALPGIPLPFADGPVGAFPIAPFGGLETADGNAALAARFEAEVLAPARLAAIYAAWPTSASGPSGASEATLPPAGPTSTFVTPQGLRLDVNSGLWSKLTLASSAGQALALADIDPRLAAAFQAEQLFLVIDATGLAKLQQGYCEALFDALDIGGWLMRLDPGNWVDGTLLVVKFAKSGLETLAADPSQWTLPELATGDPAAAQKALQAAIAAAKGSADSDYDYFRDTVLKDWTGIVAFNVQVPANAFPEQLVALSAGLTGPLLAHHFGADLSPVELDNGVPAIRDAKLFGLIAIEDDVDLTYHGSAYDFKTRSLRVLFANSEVAAFSSKIELLVGQLFGERSQLVGATHGDNIMLNGTLQKHDGSDVYSFSQQGPNSFAIESAVLQSVQVTSARMVTVPGPTGPTGPAAIAGPGGPSGASGASARFTALFPLAGTVAFQEQPGFDLFSFGPTGMTGPIGPTGATFVPGFATQGLRFSNLIVSMSFTEGATNRADRQFAFDATQAQLDLPSSFIRPGSLYDGLPLTAAGFLQGGALPPSLGYLPLSTPPLTTGSLGSTWYGIAMDLALGTRGGLADMAPLTASLLTAWAPGPAGGPKPLANAATLAMLPGTRGIRSLGLQGPLKLELGASSIERTEDAAGNAAYVMRFNDISLSLFGLKFPSGGRTNVALFGDPAGRGGSLGWYAAYLKNPPSGSGSNMRISADRTGGRADR